MLQLVSALKNPTKPGEHSINQLSRYTARPDYLGWRRRVGSALSMKQYSGAELGVKCIENPDRFLHVKERCVFHAHLKTTANQVVFSAAIRGRQTMEIYEIWSKLFCSFWESSRNIPGFWNDPLEHWYQYLVIRWSSETQSTVGFPQCWAYINSDSQFGASVAERLSWNVGVAQIVHSLKVPKMHYFHWFTTQNTQIDRWLGVLCLTQ